MGAFNTMRATASCPSCRERVPVAVQFKYGNTRQLAYDLGDQLHWGGNQVGSPDTKRVVLEGVAESACPICGYDGEWKVYVLVENDRLVGAETATGEYDFGKEDRTYVILEDE